MSENANLPKQRRKFFSVKIVTDNVYPLVIAYSCPLSPLAINI